MEKVAKMEEINYRKLKIKRCRQFMLDLEKTIGIDYKHFNSCNRDISSYLIPKGTEKQITYHSKPEKSFRFSDHWNWYTNEKKCDDLNYVQCFSVNLPEPNNRIAYGKGSEPIRAIQIAFYFKGKYYAVFGDYYDFSSNKWKWIDSYPRDVAGLLFINPKMLTRLCSDENQTYRLLS